MDPPLPAPRVVRTPNATPAPPLAPTRRKKKAAPSPPGPSLGAKLSPRSSTMHSSVTSLPGISDLSPIRPIQPASSVLSLASIGRRKRRAPPPPNKPELVTRPEDKEQREVREETGSVGSKDIIAQRDKLGGSDILLVDSGEITVHSETIEQQDVTGEGNITGLNDINEPNDITQESDTLENTPKVKDIIDESTVIVHTDITGLREEHKEKKKKKKKDKDKEKSDIEAEGDEKKKKKKKHKHHKDDPEHGEKKKKKHKHHHEDRENPKDDTAAESKVTERAQTDAPDVVEEEERVEQHSPIMFTKEDHMDVSETVIEDNLPTNDDDLYKNPMGPPSLDVKAPIPAVMQDPIIADCDIPDPLVISSEVIESSVVTPEPNNSKESEDEDEKSRYEEEKKRKKDRKEMKRRKREEGDGQWEQATYVTAPELPSFRGARASKNMSAQEEEAKEASMIPDTAKTDSDDSLVDSEDELVDLFSMSSKDRTVKKSSSQAEGKKRGKQSSQAPGDKDEGRPKRVTAKEREEARKEQIRIEQRQGTGGEEAVQHGSETLRIALTQLSLGEGESNVKAYKTKWKEVELEIEEDDMNLPSMGSSRSNSVLELSSDEEGIQQAAEHRQFAMKELEKEVTKQRVQVNPEISKALDESFAEMSLKNEARDSYVAVSDTIFVETEELLQKESAELYEAKNPHLVSVHTDEIVRSQTMSLVRTDSGDGQFTADGASMQKGREVQGVTRFEGGAPSPDSGIHDYNTGSCVSPVSSLGLGRDEDDEGRGEKQGPSTPDSGLDLHGSEVTSSAGTDVCLQDVAEEEEEEVMEQVAVERVQLPRRHSGKVLFSMASYQERGPLALAPAPAPTERTESYRRVSTQLNSNLAVGMERAKEAERRSREAEQRRSREQEQEQMLKEAAAEEKEKRKRLQREKEDLEAPRKSEEVEVRWRIKTEAGLRPTGGPGSRTESQTGDNGERFKAGQEPQAGSAAFKSRIIEQFEERRGIVIVGSSMQGAAAGARAPRGHTPRPVPQSATTTEGDREGVTRGTNTREGVTRSLDRKEMPSWSDGQFASLQRGLGSGKPEEPPAIGPASGQWRGYQAPSISLQVWGEEPRLRKVTVREDRDTVLVGRRISQPEAGEEVVTSGGACSALTQQRPATGQHSTQHSAQSRAGNSPQHQEGDSIGRKQLWQRPAPSRPHLQPLPIEIRYKSGEAAVTDVMDDPRVSVLSAAKQSRGGANDSRVWQKPQKSATYGRGYVGARAEDFERAPEDEPQRKPFYFGMSPPDRDDLPSLPTAIGKVRDNEALSQPFRTAPRHRTKTEPKDTKGAKEVLIVPVAKPVSKQRVVVAQNMNNNSATMTSLNPVGKPRLRPLPPKEQPQEELSLAFQEQLAKAKLKLRSSGPSEEGAPPPPPAPVLPGIATSKPGPPPPPAPALKPQWERRVSSLPKGPIVNPRDELMRAIREKAGRPAAKLSQPAV